MCGIVGYVGPRQATPILIEGLRRLEYRGYDSAGVAVRGPARHGGGALPGQAGEPRGDGGRATALEGTLGIGHTRWATHGRPSEANAHPHRRGGVAVVHNGIIENYLALRARLSAARAAGSRRRPTPRSSRT